MAAGRLPQPPPRMQERHAPRARAKRRYASGKGVSTGQAGGGGWRGGMGTPPRRTGCLTNGSDHPSRTSELKAATQLRQLRPLPRHRMTRNERTVPHPPCRLQAIGRLASLQSESSHAATPAARQKNAPDGSKCNHHHHIIGMPAVWHCGQPSTRSTNGGQQAAT